MRISDWSSYVCSSDLFSLAAGSHFSYDLFERISLRFNATSDGNITQGTETNHFAFHLLAIAQLQMIRNRQPGIVTIHNIPLVRNVKRRNSYVFIHNIAPDLHFRPVTDREYPEMFSHVLSPVENITELRPLVLGVLLSKLIRSEEHTSELK